MRQEQFALQRTEFGRKRRKEASVMVIKLGLSTLLFLKAVNKAYSEHSNIIGMMRRKGEVQNVNFNLNSMSDYEMLKDFRFLLPEIKKLSDMLGWNGVTARNSYVCEPILACAIFLLRMATPTRWYDCELKFGMYSSKLSEIYCEIVEYLIEKCGSLLDLNDEVLQQRTTAYANPVKEAGAPLNRCVGFIDCTKIRMCRPGGTNVNQRSCYSGHKRVHCLSYQTLTTPDGLIFALHGPIVGHWHDLTLLRDSNWNLILDNCLFTSNQQYYINGDSAYQIRPWMQRPFRGNCSELQRKFNQKERSARLC